MIQLVLIYCLASHPGVCQEQRPVPEQPLSLMGCMVAGPRLGAAWTANHPKWRLSGWRCRGAGREETHA